MIPGINIISELACVGSVNGTRESTGAGVGGALNTSAGEKIFRL